MPQRAPRIRQDQHIEICRLALRQVPHTEIARRTGVHRNTVRKVLARTRGALQVNDSLEQERSGAIALYREIQRTAWEAAEVTRERGHSPAALLAEVRLAQTRIDAILGLTMATKDPAADLAAFKAIVLDVIRAEAPEIGERLSRRLLEARKDGNGHQR